MKATRIFKIIVLFWIASIIIYTAYASFEEPLIVDKILDCLFTISTLFFSICMGCICIAFDNQERIDPELTKEIRKDSSLFRLIVIATFMTASVYYVLCQVGYIPYKSIGIGLQLVNIIADYFMVTSHIHFLETLLDLGKKNRFGENPTNISSKNNE